MPQHRLFDVSSVHIAALDDEGLRLLIARLCEADLRGRDLSTSAVGLGPFLADTLPQYGANLDMRAGSPAADEKPQTRPRIDQPCATARRRRSRAGDPA